jgi:hypothetical protein
MTVRRLALACTCLIGLTAAAVAQVNPPPAAAPAATPAPAAATAASPAPASQASTSPAAASSAGATPAATAQAAPASRVRGNIVSVSPHLLTVRTLGGETEAISLTEPLTVVTLKRVKLSSIKQGDYLGVASRSGPNGGATALEVLVFPEAMRGAGAGHYDWDLRPGSMMTNAPVTGVAKRPAGRDLTLTWQGGTTTIHVPPSAPVVTFAPAVAADLKPGRQVFVIARKDAEGHLVSGRVTVGMHGVNPPM